MQRRKGDIVGIIFFIVLMLVFAISFLCYSYIFGATTTAFKGTILNSTPETNYAVEYMEDFGGQSLQKIYVFLFFGMLLATMISAFLVRVHPVFLVVYILLFFINIFIAIFAANTYSAMNTGLLATYYGSNTMITAIMDNIVRITIVANGISLLLLFGRLFSAQPSAGGM